MIVRADGPAWLCITQPDHARLAGALAEAWCADGFPDRPTRARVLEATIQHDLGWAIEDAAPRVNLKSGEPFDFMTAPVAMRQAIWPRAVATLARDDPYVAALVAQHALTVYRRFQHDPEWRTFFPALEALRDDLVVAAASPGFTSFLQDYTIVGLCDLFSLVFCNGWPEPYLMEGYRTVLSGDRLTISPDPFDGSVVRLEVAARRIPRRRYHSDADLRETLAATPAVAVTGMAIGGPAFAGT